MNLTDHQAKYFAYELTRRFPPDSVEKVTVAFAGALVDLNPHQIDAAKPQQKPQQGQVSTSDIKRLFSFFRNSLWCMMLNVET